MITGLHDTTVAVYYLHKAGLHLLHEELLGDLARLLEAPPGALEALLHCGNVLAQLIDS